jgi:hypothetical protein
VDLTTLVALAVVIGLTELVVTVILRELVVDVVGLTVEEVSSPQSSSSIE